MVARGSPRRRRQRVMLMSSSYLAHNEIIKIKKIPRQSATCKATRARCLVWGDGRQNTKAGQPLCEMKHGAHEPCHVEGRTGK